MVSWKTFLFLSISFLCVCVGGEGVLYESLRTLLGPFLRFSYYGRSGLKNCPEAYHMFHVLVFLRTQSTFSHTTPNATQPKLRSNFTEVYRVVE